MSGGKKCPYKRMTIGTIDLPNVPEGLDRNRCLLRFRFPQITALCARSLSIPFRNVRARTNDMIIIHF